MNVGRELRNNVVSNVWPQTQLELLHPSESYNGSQLRAITPIHTMMHSFMLAEGGEQKLPEFVGSVTADLSAWALDIGNAIADYYGGMINGEIMDRIERLRYQYSLVSGALSDAHWAMATKEKKGDARPEWCKHPEYVDTADTPCLFSLVVANTVKRARNFLKLGDKDAVLLYDTAFLLAMLPAMAGLNSPEACMYSLKFSNLKPQ